MGGLGRQQHDLITAGNADGFAVMSARSPTPALLAPSGRQRLARQRASLSAFDAYRGLLMDVWSEAKRSEVMSRIRSTGTKPERRLEAIVRGALPRYKILTNDPSLPGRPDVVVTSLKLAIFMDGCFWHGCPSHCRMPSTRVEYWQTKILRTMQRDRRDTRVLRADGWSVWHVWEHDLQGPRLEPKAARLTCALRARAARQG